MNHPSTALRGLMAPSRRSTMRLSPNSCAGLRAPSAPLYCYAGTRHLRVWTLKSSEMANPDVARAAQRTIKMEVAVAALASGRMPARCPAVGGSPWIERVDVHTPDHQLRCIAGL